MKLASSFGSLAFAAGALIAPTLAHAALDNDSSFTPLVGVALTTGGDELARVQFSGGSTSTIKAGGLLQVWGGVEYGQYGSPFAVQATFGYHVDRIDAKNGSLRFERFPLEVIGLYSVDDSWRVGAGLRYAYAARLTSSGAASDIIGADYRAKLAPLVMAEWLVTTHQGVQLRYVHEKYRLDGASYDGSHYGLGYNFYF
jgi:hypothetical protein